MCMICKALDPSIDDFDQHVDGNLDNNPNAASTTPTNKPIYDYDDIADYLTEDFWYDFGTVPRHFDVQYGDTITYNIDGLTNVGKDAAIKGFEAWTAVSGLQFQAVAKADAQIVFDDNQAGAWAGSSRIGEHIHKSTINIETNWMRFGEEYYHQTYMHEIGHALGLGHTGNYNGSGNYARDAGFANDSWQASVMSYFSQNQNTFVDASFAFTATLQLGDIAAIHKLYGTPDNVAVGDTVYGDNHTTGVFGHDLSGTYSVAIYDSGGTDHINLASRSHDQRLDLNQEEHSDINGKIGNFAIGRDAVIENATTGSGDDYIIGNSADNRIDAGAGDDEILAGAGDDIIIGGAGADILTGGTGADRFVYEALDHAGDTITDFDLTAGDTIDLNGVLTQIGYTGTSPVTDGIVSLVAGSGGAWLVVHEGSETTQLVFLTGISETADLGAIIDSGETPPDPNPEPASPDNIYVIGADFAASWTAQRGEIADSNGGTDTLDITAISGNVNVSLESGVNGTVAGKRLVVSEGTVIENLALGAGDDKGFGNAANNIIDAGAGDDSIHGNAGDDTLSGGLGADSLYGGDGNDTINGGDQHDRLFGGAGDDTINGGAGDDMLYGNAGNNTLNGGEGDNTVFGDSGIDTVTAGAGDDRILTYGGDDIIDAGNGTNDIDSGAGNDSITAGSGADSISTGSGNNIVNAGAGDNWIQTGNGNNTLTTLGGDDYIQSGGGDDVINGGDGNNTILAGNGANEVTVGSGIDVIRTGTGDDIIHAGNGANQISAGIGNNTITSGLGNDVISTLAGNDTIDAGDGDNRITDSGGDNLVTSGAGDDQIRITSGDNVIDAGNGDNRITTGTGNDTITSGNDADHIRSGGGDDTINAGGGNNSIFAGNGNNQVTAGAGNDFLLAGNGNAIVDLGGGNNRINLGDGVHDINTGFGNDRIFTGNGDVTIDAGDGRNVIRTGNGDDDITTGDGRDVIWANAGNDTISAGAGNDMLDGGAGDDWLNGGAGFDVLKGGSGADTFYFGSLAETGGRIDDFSRSDLDQIDVSDLLIAIGTDLDTALLTESLFLRNAGHSAWLSLDHDGNAGTAAHDIVLLRGIDHEENLTSDWFVA